MCSLCYFISLAVVFWCDFCKIVRQTPFQHQNPRLKQRHLVHSSKTKHEITHRSASSWSSALQQACDKDISIIARWITRSGRAPTRMLHNVQEVVRLKRRWNGWTFSGYRQHALAINPRIEPGQIRWYGYSRGGPLILTVLSYIIKL